MMNPAPARDVEQLHQTEETRTDGDDFQPKDMTTDRGYKLPRSLPFSVESLISRSTCRTSFPPSGSAAAPPKLAAGQGARFSPRTFYADSRVPAESSEEDSPHPVSSFSTPPRKSVPPIVQKGDLPVKLPDILHVSVDFIVSASYFPECV